ncbi:unnamed protein product [Nippostrongylus brasiliensis]|uniref:phosphoacetylglucosamine mutase n=1 Tax=Nippostrongylus brasiliensis TaxID=27835 RepID=A0A0N4YJE9_NIPBR|nr:unnamed protein product [Nippostrongylus brasiliensis]
MSGMNSSLGFDINTFPILRILPWLLGFLGTAGFRYDADLLPFVVFRMGYLAGLRARELNRAIGLMITASHNPAKDNGVKIIDPNGEMLAPEWEKYASELVNASDDQLPTAVRALEVQVETQRSPTNALVMCAMDSRESGPYLIEAAKAGAALMGVACKSYAIPYRLIPISILKTLLRLSLFNITLTDKLTTPQLHFIVKCQNDPTFGDPTELWYYVRLSDAFKALVKMGTKPGNSNPSNYSPKLVLDCANGVGAEKMRKMCEFLSPDLLNCGADFVKIGQELPAGFDDVDVTTKCASFDGDADRLIYFRSIGDENRICLFDGDFMAALLAKYIKEVSFTLLLL